MTDDPETAGVLAALREERIAELENELTALRRQNARGPKPSESDLGSGVYASFDGLHIWLRSDRPYFGGGSVALPPTVFEALLRYRAELGLATPGQSPPCTGG